MKSNKNFTCRTSIVAILFVIFESCNAATNEYGVLAAESSSEKENFCIVYFKEFAGLPSEKSKAEFHILQDASELNWCEDHPKVDYSSKVLLLSKRNCSVSSQVLNIQSRGGKAVFFLSPSGKVSHVDVNDTDAELVNITVGLLSEASARRLKKMGNPVTVKLFAPGTPSFDYSLLVIWIVAMFTVSVGAYWSGLIRFALFCKEMSKIPAAQQQQLPNKPSVKVNPVEESSLNISAYAVGAFVMCMGLMLMLLYFLYDYLIYVIISLFVLASILSIHSCLEPLVLRLKCSFCKTDLRCGNKICRVDFRQVVLVAFAISIVVLWVVMRNERGFWILQDILGVMFCIHMLKSIRLPNFKICTILLVLLFFYDIFFVFVTPYITGKTESVMEEVATGGSSSSETLPMVLKVAHFGFEPLSVCYQQFSILGFGDILVPGLLVSYCHGFDLVTNKKRIYYFTTVIGYGLGLLVTFGALFLMSSAQPALFYLVPCTLLPPAAIAWCRGEFGTLWKGFKVVPVPTDAPNYPEVQVAGNAPPPAAIEDPPIATEGLPPKQGSMPPEETTDGEQKLLLH